MKDDAIQEALLGMRQLYRHAGSRSYSILRAFVLGNMVRRFEDFNGFPRFYTEHVKRMIPHVLICGIWTPEIQICSAHVIMTTW